MPIADSPMTCVFRVCRILETWPLRIESAAYFEGGDENSNARLQLEGRCL
jgi:hypothetical protein